MPDPTIESLREVITQKDAEIDLLRARNRELVASMTCCARRNELGADCRVWLVMNDMLKTKRRVRRDGR